VESVRYFLFVPWLFRMLKQAERERFAQRTRQLQDQLRRSLVKGGESLGVIGYLAGGNVQGWSTWRAWPQAAAATGKAAGGLTAWLGM
jgi:hypothetical protein